MFLSLLFRFHMFLYFPFLFWSLTLFFLFAKMVPLPFYLSDWSLGAFCWAWPILVGFFCCFLVYGFFVGPKPILFSIFLCYKKIIIIIVITKKSNNKSNNKRKKKI